MHISQEKDELAFDAIFIVSPGGSSFSIECFYGKLLQAVAISASHQRHAIAVVDAVRLHWIFPAGVSGAQEPRCFMFQSDFCHIQLLIILKQWSNQMEIRVTSTSNKKEKFWKVIAHPWLHK